jgi:hypothetical protein
MVKAWEDVAHESLESQRRVDEDVQSNCSQYGDKYKDIVSEKAELPVACTDKTLRPSNKVSHHGSEH